MAKVNFKITVGVKQRAEIRQICNLIKTNPAHFETIELVNKDASAKLSVKFESGKIGTYAAQVRTLIDGLVVAIDWLQSNSFNDIENFIRGKCSVEVLNEAYLESLRPSDLSEEESAEIDQMIAAQKVSKKVFNSKQNNHVLKPQYDSIQDPLDIVLMNSLLLVRKGDGILKPGQVLDTRGLSVINNNINVELSVNNIYHDELQYTGSQSYTLARLSIAVANGDLAIICGSAPAKYVRLYDDKGIHLGDQAINPEARITAVAENFIKGLEYRRVTFHYLEYKKAQELVNK